ncbi:MAG: beta-ketoacyl synthase chain length factor [Deltaproteobacteria bacterium]|nr:beta-ketoacyl synthase chain length factor [Deltaproteobacteria bacterium]
MSLAAITIVDWSGRAFQLENKSAFRNWILSPRELEDDPGYKPECPDVPARLRGKSSTLSRLVMAPFFEVTSLNRLHPSEVDLVFASRYGEIRTLETLLDAIYCFQPVSPLDFCNSVHHTATGYISIAAQNRGISRTVSAGEQTFAAGLMECWQLLHTGRSETVALLVGDEAVPSFFDTPSRFAYGLAILFQKSKAGDQFPISLDRIQEVCNLSVSATEWLRQRLKMSEV